MFQDITVEELIEVKDKPGQVLIDVRSPSEYRDFTIPGSINIPLFDDSERAEIGTLYKQVSVQAAKERGLEVVSAKLPEFVKAFRDIPGEKTVFCWRGGMRSKTTATVLDLMGIHTHRLQGGIHEYRKKTVHMLEDYPFKPEAYVLNGYTGAGKTLILKHLQEEGYPVLDLERMANHRGSIFGQIGLRPHNQKMFDALLLERISQVKDEPYVLFEAESKRIGKAVLPEFLTLKKERGFQIFIDMPIEERVRHILEDYQPWGHHDECIQAFQKIKKRIHTPIAAEIAQCLEAKEYARAVQLLLEYYYDPLYKYTADQYPEDRRMILQAKNIEDAAERIKEVLQNTFSGYAAQ
ncbi:tRNA 2-selenouridine(34) synthase MnmH [Bacillus testis]|uniref:tRNA 2-selenouridine(34) synthase MnmH n=1 Tax=Bacillus testis TaxID=1622072 RepID=UPI00067F1467|nr:tRNA 2-selenouridine(34) synthase MnmH [Bacillus testis]